MSNAKALKVLTREQVNQLIDKSPYAGAHYTWWNFDADSPLGHQTASFGSFNHAGCRILVDAMHNAAMVEHLRAQLAQARLEGAKAMHEAAAVKMKGIGDLGWSAESTIRALDPQQVINEGVGESVLLAQVSSKALLMGIYHRHPDIGQRKDLQLDISAALDEARAQGIESVLAREEFNKVINESK